MATPELIPLEILFGNPDKFSPRISPDGRRLAYIAPHEGVLNVWLGAIGSDDFKPITDDRDRGIRSFNWCHDNRTILYTQDQGGDENFRIYSVNTDGGPVVDRTPFEGVQAQLLALSKERPDQVVIGIKDNEQLHDAYVLTLSTGNLEKVAENPGYVQWAIDHQLNVRGGAAPRADGGFDFQIDDKLVLAVDMEDGLSTDIIGFTKDGAGLFVKTSAGANAARLFVLDLASGEQTVIAEDPKYDVDIVVLHPETREVQLVGFVEDRLRYQVLDSSIQADIDALQRLHHGDLVLQGRDHADRTWLAAYTADDGPVSFFAWDRDKQEATFLFDHMPALTEYELAKMEPFSFEARDGLTVHGYITFPVGVERSNLPAVLNVHGGPWARDEWGFNPEAQWLANRGYVCVQVNYRGSTGYGKDFVNAGNREWGAKMHDDLLDAVDFVVGQGWVDRERVAIYGGLLRRLRGAGRRHVHARRVPLRGRHRRPVEHQDADREHPALLGAARRAVPHAGRQPRHRGGLPLVAVTAVEGRPDQDPDADRPGRQRSAREAGRVGADRGRHEGEGHRPRVPALPRRGPRLRQAREQPQVLRRAERFLAQHLGGRAVD